MDIRQRIVKEARSYIGTPFEHQGRLKRCGVDCVGILIGVAHMLRLTNHNYKGYSRFPEGDELIKKLDSVLIRIPTDEIQDGDVLVFSISRRTKIPQHVALKTDIGMLHTYQTIGKVVEHGLTQKWRRRLCAAYRFPGVD